MSTSTRSTGWSNLVGELVITQAMLSQRVFECRARPGSPVGNGLDELEHLMREIQDGVMAIRAQPVKSVFQRMPRLVREVAGPDQQAGPSRHWKARRPRSTRP